MREEGMERRKGRKRKREETFSFLICSIFRMLLLHLNQEMPPKFTNRANNSFNIYRIKWIQKRRENAQNQQLMRRREEEGREKKSIHNKLLHSSCLRNTTTCSNKYNDTNYNNSLLLCSHTILIFGNIRKHRQQHFFVFF